MMTTRLARALAFRLLVSLVLSVITAVLLRTIHTTTTASVSSHHTSSLSHFVTRPTDMRLADVGGLTDAKRVLTRTVLLPLQHPHLFFGPRAPASLRPPAGVLLCGPPGTGKTLLARALASEARVPLLSLHAAALESKWYGDSAKLLEAAFALARTQLAPCIVFFDELDGLGRVRSEQDQACVYSLKCELLRHLDGIGKSTAAMAVVACTNCPAALDPALRRRFSCQLEIARPNEAERRAILDTLEVDSDPSVLTRVAAATPWATGAQLAALAKEASAQRLETLPQLAETVSEAASGDELLARLGRLRWKHWQAALARCAPTA